MEITRREIICSISIIAILLIIGIFIAGAIKESELDRNEQYTKAIHIQDPDIFRHGMNTNVGNAFCYGDLIALDPVTYPEIGGEYSYIEKVREEYRKHTRTVTKTKTVNGKTKTYTDTETYWTWDKMDSESKKSTRISFLGFELPYGTIDFPASSHIDTIKESRKVRYKYYGTETKYTGTIYTDLRDGTISANNEFYCDKSTGETAEYLMVAGGVIIFWFFWIILIGGIVVAFYYAENKWLGG